MNRLRWMALGLVLAIAAVAVWWVMTLGVAFVDAVEEDEPLAGGSPQAVDEPTSGRRRIRLEQPGQPAIRRPALPNAPPPLVGRVEGVTTAEATLDQVQARVTALLSEQCVGVAWEEAIRTSETVDYLVAGETEIQVELDGSGVADVFLLDNGGSSDVLLGCYADQVWGEQWPSVDEAVVLSLDVHMLIEVDMNAGTLSFPNSVVGDEAP